MPRARHLVPALALLLAACGAGGGGDDVTAVTGEELGGALTVEYPCGLGFAVASEDQRFALVIHHRGPGDAAPEGPVSLPDPEWRAEVLVGTDLMANWCDDVIGPDEPTAEVSETWPVVGGELTYESPDELPQGCSGETVTAEVTDLTVESSTGERLTLPDRSITNEAYGCFAG